MGTERTRPGSRVQEQGQAVPLVLLVMAVAVAAMLVVVHLGGTVVDRARARTAADAAALAGAEGGRATAERAARDNDGMLEAWTAGDGYVEVTVRVGRARATARARPGPSGPIAPEVWPHRETMTGPKWSGLRRPWHATVRALRSGAIAQSVRAHP